MYIYIYIYWSYDPHRSRESVSPVCGIFHSEACLASCKIKTSFSHSAMAITPLSRHNSCDISRVK